MSCSLPIVDGVLAKGDEVANLDTLARIEYSAAVESVENLVNLIVGKRDFRRCLIVVNRHHDEV